MKNKFTMMLCCFAIAGNTQDMTFNNIHKLAESKKYREAIPQLQEFVKKERRHVSAHYDLANCYVGILNELVKIQNANVQNQNTALWSDKEYKDNLNFWNNGIGVTDSAIIYYKETSELMNIQFLTLDLRYNELYEATKDCGVIQKVKCARNYLAEVIDNYEKTNVSNKSRLFNEEKKYEEFKNKSIIKNETAQSNSLLIHNSGIGNIYVRKTKISDIEKISNIKLKKEIRYGEEASEFPVYVGSENGEKVYEITPDFDSEKVRYTDVVGTIEVFSDRYKNSKGVGAGTTLREFFKIYPDMTVGYTYITSRFIVTSEQEGLMQFDLKEEDYIGNKKKLDAGGGDWVVLTDKDFIQNAKIKSVRIY